MMRDPLLLQREAARSAPKGQRLLDAKARLPASWKQISTRLIISRAMAACTLARAANRRHKAASTGSSWS
jgi:hypothetical protein